MSAQEDRNLIIRESLPLLLKSMTGFNEDEENYIRCKQFAMSILRNHRTISTNSHEIKRKIDAMKEKFQYDNLLPEAEVFAGLCEAITQHPLVSDHYEIDLQWSLVDMLISLAYNPTKALRKNPERHLFKVEKTKEVETEEVDLELWRAILKEDIPAYHQYSSSDELSEWSDDDSVLSSSDSKESIKSFLSKTSGIVEKVSSTNFKPPQKDVEYKVLKIDKDFATKLFQKCWWFKKTPHLKIDSKLVLANFAEIFNNYLNEKNDGSIKNSIDLAEEYCLIKEILWMFHKAVDCKFFELKNNRVEFKDNTTIPSVTPDGLKIFVEDQFLIYIRMMNEMKQFIDTAKSLDGPHSPKTFECYISALQHFLKSVWENILGAELNMMQPNKNFPCTIINLRDALHESLKWLKSVYEIHQNATLDLEKFPPHILSIYMLTKLVSFSEIATTSSQSNLAISIFLTVVKVYCNILDSWWSRGRLDDSQQEFLVESIKKESNGDVHIRPLSKHIDKGLEKLITKNRIYCLLMEHCIEAGSLLNLLYGINRISDLRKVTGALNGTLYETFLAEVMQNIRNLRCHNKDIALSNTESELKAIEYNHLETPSKTSLKSLKSSKSLKDQHLALAFDRHKQGALMNQIKSNAHVFHPQNIFDELQAVGTFVPSEEIIIRTFKKILRTRIAVADSFVIEMFMKEFSLVTHLQNLRKVLLLEAGDLMFQFYRKLFKKIETRDDWANSYVLTMELNDLLCSRYPDMNALFSVEVQSALTHETSKVCEAVDKFIIKYNVPKELSYIITPNSLKSYNQILQILLKVKWGLITLENMKFVRHSNRLLLYFERLDMSELLMRQLEQLRFWLIYDLQIIHFHLTSHVLHSMGLQLEKRLEKCNNVKEIKKAHKSYLETMYKYCCLVPNMSAIKLGIEQTINLVFVLRLEWKACSHYMENLHPLSTDITDSSTDEELGNYLVDNQVKDIERAYTRCHQYLAENLSKQVYYNHHDFLSGLSYGFNGSLPY